MGTDCLALITPVVQVVLQGASNAPLRQVRNHLREPSSTLELKVLREIRHEIGNASFLSDCATILVHRFQQGREHVKLINRPANNQTSDHSNKEFEQAERSVH